MHTRLLACALALLPVGLTPLVGQTPKHGMTVDDLAKMVRVGAPVLSPDGQWIAYTVTSVNVGDDKNVTQLWMISWDGSQDIQLTHGKDSVGNPRWSPDGRWLSFTSSRDGDAKGAQVWVLDRRGGEAVQLTNVKQDLNGYRWSPDSKQLLLTLEEKDEPDDDKGGKPKPPKPIVIDRYQFKQDMEGYLTDKAPQLYLFEIAGKKLARLTDTKKIGAVTCEEESAEWSPDGKWIAFVSNQAQPDPDRVANKDIFVVSATAGSTPRQLTTFMGEDEGPLAWTPDSKDIVFREGVTPHYSIYDMPQLVMVAAAGGAPVMLAPKLDKWVGGPVIEAAGKRILTTVSDDRDQYLASIALDGSGVEKRLVPAHGSANGVDSVGDHVALLWTTDVDSSEIYALDAGKLRKLTSHNDALMAGLKIAPSEELATKTSDGSEVHSLLTMPIDYAVGTKVPMLLRIHGGPTSQDAHGFNAERQLFAAHGYAVLNVNYRGSTGRGHGYSEAINADWGHLEVIDLLSAVQDAIATGKIDTDKLGVGGWSYGGILTDYLIASTNEFKAASSGAGMGNLLGLYGVDEYILQYENELGPPWKNPDAYIKLSYPFFHADRIKTPTLFMGGDKDFNVPLAGGEQMYEALKSVGTPAELVVYPGQFHGFTRPSFIADRYERWFGWYDKYVRGITPEPAKPAAKK